MSRVAFETLSVPVERLHDAEANQLITKYAEDTNAQRFLDSDHFTDHSTIEAWLERSDVVTLRDEHNVILGLSWLDQSREETIALTGFSRTLQLWYMNNDRAISYQQDTHRLMEEEAVGFQDRFLQASLEHYFSLVPEGISAEVHEDNQSTKTLLKRNGFRELGSVGTNHVLAYAFDTEEQKRITMPEETKPEAVQLHLFAEIG